MILIRCVKSYFLKHARSQKNVTTSAERLQAANASHRTVAQIHWPVVFGSLWQHLTIISLNNIEVVYLEDFGPTSFLIVFEDIWVEQPQLDAAHYQLAEKNPEIFIVALTELKSNIVSMREFVNQHIKIYIDVNVSLFVLETQFC